MILVPGQRVHFVGIGGIGLSAIARVMLRQGYRVSGSDRQSNAQTEALANEGAIIYEGSSQVHELMQGQYALGYRTDRPLRCELPAYNAEEWQREA